MVNLSSKMMFLHVKKRLVVNVRRDEFFKCDLCQHVSMFKTNLDDHYRKCHKICKLCGFRCDRFANLQVHLNEKHAEGARKAIKRYEEIGSGYPCHYCDFSGLCGQDLKEHRSRIHVLCDDSGMYKCPSCPYKRAVSNDVIEHIERRHDKPRRLECPLCNFKSVYYVNVQKHLKLHSMEKLKCTLCRREFATSFSLKKHTEKKHLAFDSAGMVYESQDLDYSERTYNDDYRITLDNFTRSRKDTPETDPTPIVDLDAFHFTTPSLTELLCHSIFTEGDSHLHLEQPSVVPDSTIVIDDDSQSTDNPKRASVIINKKAQRKRQLNNSTRENRPNSDDECILVPDETINSTREPFVIEIDEQIDDDCVFIPNTAEKEPDNVRNLTENVSKGHKESGVKVVMCDNTNDLDTPVEEHVTSHNNSEELLANKNIESNSEGTDIGAMNQSTSCEGVKDDNSKRSEIGEISSEKQKSTDICDITKDDLDSSSNTEEYSDVELPTEISKSNVKETVNRSRGSNLTSESCKDIEDNTSGELNSSKTDKETDVTCDTTKEDTNVCLDNLPVEETLTRSKDPNLTSQRLKEFEDDSLKTHKQTEIMCDITEGATDVCLDNVPVDVELSSKITESNPEKTVPRIEDPNLVSESCKDIEDNSFGQLNSSKTHQQSNITEGATDLCLDNVPVDVELSMKITESNSKETVRRIKDSNLTSDSCGEDNSSGELGIRLNIQTDVTCDTTEDGKDVCVPVDVELSNSEETVDKNKDSNLTSESCENSEDNSFGELDIGVNNSDTHKQTEVV